MKKVSPKSERKVKNPDLSANGIREIQPKRSKKKFHFMLYLAIVGFAFYAVITIVNQNMQISEKEIELGNLQQQIKVVEIQTSYLKKVQDYKGEELNKYMEKIAKEELGYIGEGERIFFNVAGE